MRRILRFRPALWLLFLALLWPHLPLDVFGLTRFLFGLTLSFLLTQFLVLFSAPLLLGLTL